MAPSRPRKGVVLNSQQSGSGRPDQNPGARAGAVVLALVIGVFKVIALRNLLHDGRVFIYVILGLGAIRSLYRGRPLTTALMIAVIIPVAIRPHPLLAAIGTGAVAFLALGIFCYLLGALLNLFEK